MRTQPHSPSEAAATVPVPHHAERGPSWRHEKTREVYCRTTTAEPMPEACHYCRWIQGHDPVCITQMWNPSSVAGTP